MPGIPHDNFRTVFSRIRSDCSLQSARKIPHCREERAILPIKKHSSDKGGSEVRKLFSSIRARLLGRIAWLVVVLVNWSIRVRFVNREPIDRLLRSGEPVIYAFFHGDMTPLLHVYRNSGILIPASESRDGDIMARLLMNCGFTVARGSTKRKGHRALRGLIRGMRRGETVAISVDGPRGPLHEVKPGVVYLAGLMKAPIIPTAASLEHAWVMKKSWDKLMIPVPFSSCRVLYGKPIYVVGTADEETEAARKELETSLKGLKHIPENPSLNVEPGWESSEPI
jgi:lysophospholipid acyltransferase (LPLAT)-like uncharacterized protein